MVKAPTPTLNLTLPLSPYFDLQGRDSAEWAEGQGSHRGSYGGIGGAGVGVSDDGGDNDDGDGDGNDEDAVDAALMKQLADALAHRIKEIYDP